MPYQSGKIYGHEVGLTACFRQWRAQSHCQRIHGYALAIELEFEADDLDARNWVVDFGSLKPFKALLENTFDHKMLVAEDDPALSIFKQLEAEGLADIVVVEATGCEAFARLVFEACQVWLRDAGYAPRVRITRAVVREHGANWAAYTGGAE